jgi:hypothetical protein
MYKIFQIRTSHNSPHYAKKQQVIPSSIYDASDPRCVLVIPTEQFCSYLENKHVCESIQYTLNQQKKL